MLKAGEYKKISLSEVNSVASTGYTRDVFKKNKLSTAQQVCCYFEAIYLDSLMKELTQHAPALLHVLKGCTLTSCKKENQDATICLCAAILLRFRNRNMNLLQRILSLIGRAKRAPHWGVQTRFRVIYIIGERAMRARHSLVCSIENRGYIYILWYVQFLFL